MFVVFIVAAESRNSLYNEMQFRMDNDMLKLV